MNRPIWLDAYPRGVPATIDPNEYASVIELLEQSFGRYGPRPALENFGVAMTYTELDEASRAFAAYL